MSCCDWKDSLFFSFFWIIFLDLPLWIYCWALPTLQQESLASQPWRKPLYWKSFLFQCFSPQRNKTFLLALFWRGWPRFDLSVQPRPVATTALFSVLKGKQCFASWCQMHIFLIIRGGIFLALRASAAIQCWAQPCRSSWLLMTLSKSLNFPLPRCFSPLPSFFYSFLPTRSLSLWWMGCLLA